MPNSLSAVQICNLSLSRIGSTARINSLDTTVDRSNEAQQCSIMYPHNRDALLTDFPFPFTKASATLAQVSATGIRATPEWFVSYRYPTDCLSARRVVWNCPASVPPSPFVPQTTAPPAQPAGYNNPSRRADGNPSPWPFEVGQDDLGRLILTDCAAAVLIYTKSIENTNLFEPDFASLLAWRLGVDLAYALAISDNRREAAEKMYMRELYKTRARQMNEAQSDQPQIGYQSEFVRARQGYGGYGGRGY